VYSNRVPNRKYYPNTTDYYGQLLHTQTRSTSPRWIVTSSHGAGVVSRVGSSNLTSVLEERLSMCHGPSVRHCSTSKGLPPSSEMLSQLSDLEYEEVSEETLESLCDAWEEIGDTFNNLSHDFDVGYSSGVLTVKLGGTLGTYVINKQTPNKQIWFSSPTSGPKRYDYIDGRWVYKYDRLTLHELLSREASKLLDSKIDFTTCSHATSTS